MSYNFLSRFVYGVTGSMTDWTTSLPTTPWEFITGTVGGSRTAAGGVPAAYVVRRDHTIALTIRLRESEWEDVHDVIRWGQFAEVITWYPDANGLVITGSYDVYLEDPLAGTPIRPRRLSDYPRVLEIPVTLRRASGVPWDLEFFV